ncbi:translation elongation factor Ts [Rickettsiella endosymbiont of Dermanyssus gallinae]|uniref:translation elongation factor Ts n=1 Tax=Rickettsiella endosymbiont of Dermanyssus gallinae TaxID=2856608 RepID=UPI001C52CAB7|nr:translation elongation factor Ts [Rickettsiella endosymbiont of Dermanyssus gallinae]
MVTPITAALVQELRARTGAGMMDCKKALTAAEGNLDAAADAMRKSGQIQAEKKSGRIAAEGLIVIKSNAERSIILEVNCETDFVARDENFKQFVDAVTQLALDKHIDSVETLLAASFPGTGESVETTRQNLIAKLGENIQIRRLAFVDAKAGGVIGSYVHTGRLGTIVQLQGGDEQLAKDLALHIIANNPLVVSADDVSNDVIAKEREIFTAQAQASGKPQAVIDKMIAGRITKFLNEVTLLGQPFIKDETMNVEKLLRESQAKVVGFVRFAVGEGIEKPKEDFAEAVMAQVKAS